MMEPATSARVIQKSDRHATRLRRTTLLLIERRRLGVTADLRRLRLPRRRYEDLCLAAALCRSAAALHRPDGGAGVGCRPLLS